MIRRILRSFLLLGVPLVHLAGPLSAQDLADGLVSYWPLDGNTADVVGGHDGVGVGAAPLSYDGGKFGAGVDLDGVDQHIVIDAANEDVFDFGAPAAPTGFTISAWFRVDAFTKSWQALIAKGEGNRWRVHRRGADAPAVFAANGGNADVPAYDGNGYPIADGELHHVAVVSTPGVSVKLFLDGDLVSTGPAPNLENGANPMMIGENPDALGRTWNGLVDDVGAWNRPLTDEEIALIWNGGEGESIGKLAGLGIPGTIELIGTGTGALLGGDLTDPENDGLDAAGAASDPSWNWVSVAADDEPDFQGGEFAFNVFDNKLGGGNDKWCCTDASPGSPRWVAVQFALPISLTHFTISSANDVPGRDPTVWQIQGSNDGANWEPIFVHNSGSIWTERLQVAKVTLAESSPGYTWFRYIAFDNNDALHQLGELEFFGDVFVPDQAELIASWDFNDSANGATAVDSVSGITGAISNAGRTGSGGGRTGVAGDYGFDVAGTGTALVTNTVAINEAATLDSISISFWQKNNGTPNSSSFWFTSPGSSGGERGLQAHVPWSNGVIYFDTAGCCDGPQRINANPTGFNGFAWNDGHWHHYTFVKNGAEKQIYIDGALFLSGANAAPLLADITALNIGSANGGGNPANAIIDDFAIFKGALSHVDAARLASGFKPHELGGDMGPDSDLDGLRDNWELANFGDLNSNASGDADGDGVSNGDEFDEGTNPNAADSDGDGLTDAEDIAHGISPTNADTDGDGLSDGFEVSFGTWPGNPDTDGDGYTDAAELGYAQDFQLADGATALGDGSIVRNDQRAANPAAGSVQGGVLQLTEDDVNSQAANYLLPPFGDLAKSGFRAVFDLTLFDAEGGNPPADGFSFNFGGIADDASAGEEGYGAGLTVSFDSWDNGGDEAAEGGSGTGIGVDIKVNGATVAINRIDPAEDKNNNSIFNFDNVSRRVEIRYVGDGDSGVVSVSLGGNVLHSNVAVDWAPAAGDRVAFGARTGGANEKVAFDNLGIACSALGDPTEFSLKPTPPTISALSVRSLDTNNVNNLNGLINGPLTDGSNIVSEVTVQAPNINYNDDAGTQGFPGDRAFPVYGVKGGHDDTGVHATGTINVAVAGVYTFVTRSDDGSILRIGGVDVVDDRTNHGARNVYGAIDLAAGDHAFEYFFYERGGGSSCELGVALIPGDFTDGTNFGQSGGGAPYALLTNPDFVLADSVRDFTAAGGVQGALGWESGYQLFTGGVAGNFERFPADWWNGSAWDFPGGNVPWTTIAPQSVHPNGDNNDTEAPFADTHQVTRRWNSNYAGDVDITWSLAKENLNCGNGVSGGVAINGEVVDSATIAFNDGTGVTRTIRATLSAGDTVDAFQNSLGTDGTLADGCDGSVLKLVVERVVFNPVGLAQQWWDVNNPGNRNAVFAVINGGNPTMGSFKGTDAGGTTTWWTGSAGSAAIPGVPNYPKALGFPTDRNEETYIAYLEGDIFLPEDGEYKFKDGVDDYTYLEIAGTVLIDDNAWTGVSGADNGGSPIVTLNGTAGWHKIKMVAAEGGGGDAGVLYWDYGPGGIGTGEGFPTANNQGIDLANNAAGLLIPEANLRSLPPADSDGDGMADEKELEWFGDLSQTLADDSDGDRSINADELAMGTNPSVKDSDGDGLWDGEEWIEVGLATLPSVRDSDGDGLSDGFELRVLGTNPNNADTDGDGLRDGLEYDNSCIYSQDFDGFANGATNFGDGSVITSVNFATSVNNGALELTREGAGSVNASFKLPHLGDLGPDFVFAFDYSLAEAAGGNPPADGFSISLGPIADGATGSEEGFGSGLAIEFDTWDNGDAENIGIDVSVNGVDAAVAAVADGTDPYNNEFFAFDGSSRHVEIIYQAGSGGVITGVTETNLGADAPATIGTGFAEDSLTFSDRTHQHNGAAFNGEGALSTSGTNIVPLPAYLVGGDFVQFANNARENVGYQAVVTASAPMNWYLLVDNRLDGIAANGSSPNTEDPVLGGTLQWVIDGGWQRVNTGISPNGQPDYTGVDEGGDGVGAGVGLNQFYSVYTLPAASSSVTVGGPQIGGNNMISLVGVPTANRVTVIQDGVVIHDQVDVGDFTPGAADRFAFAARTGGAWETLLVDNICVASGTRAPGIAMDPTDPDVPAAGPYPTVAGMITVRSVDTNSVGDLNGFINGPLTDGSNIIAEVTVEEPDINYNDDGGDLGFPGDRPYPVYGAKGGHDFTGTVGTGLIKVPRGAYWTFLTSSDDGSILRINGVDVIDDRTNHGARNRFGAIFLAAGEHPFEYLHYEQGGGSNAELGVATLPGDYTDGSNNSVQGGGLPYVLLSSDAAPAGLLVGLETDTDGDGVLDRSELLTGTDPFNSRDFFQISGVSYGVSEAGERTLVFNLATKEGMTYMLQFSPNMLPGTWENVDVMTAEEPSSAFEIMNPRAFQRREGFFRSIVVEQK